MIAAIDALQTGHVSAEDLCKNLLADRDRMLEELARKNAMIAERDRALVLSAQMIMCLSDLRGEPR